MSPPWTLLFGSREAPPWTKRNITGPNRQWWIDQYALALLAELARGSYPAWSLEPSRFTSVKRAELPMTSPDRHMSKEDFAAHYARVEVA